MTLDVYRGVRRKTTTQQQQQIVYPAWLELVLRSHIWDFYGQIYAFMFQCCYFHFHSLKIENENNNMKHVTAEAPYIVLESLEFSL